ncbi:MAG: TRZ/ATZ family hydrolase [Sterolibacterium sp.]|jgi:5-methylthioadenosine/S-adenosylhomocysteine deaminase|nr:TRZ/ATZ family hydrolase [Sterolibacterium sp.]
MADEALIAVDTLIEARWIVPVEPQHVTLEQHALAISAGRIVDILPQSEARRRYQARETVRLPQHLLLPGLVNLHTHAAMSLLRGYADDLPLMDWLQKHIWPAEARHVGAAFVRDGTLLAGAEMLRGGITCFNDMYFFPEAAAASVLRLGMRAALGMLAMDFPTAYAVDADDYLAKGLATRDALRDQPLLSFCMAPHAPYSVSDRHFEQVATLAAQINVPVHVHVHETQREIEDSLKQYGVRPLARLRRLGLLGPNLIAVHAVHLTPAEVELLALHGASVAHCPVSNLKLGSGIAPLPALQRAGVRVGLGSDGAASNNRLDLLREMNYAALLAKGSSHDAAALDAHAVLRMATLDGAAALGLDERIGSLVVGKEADLCALRLDDAQVYPCYDPVAHLVHVLGREQVSHVWVAGKLRVSDGNLLAVEASELLDMAKMWQNGMLSAA